MSNPTPADDKPEAQTVPPTGRDAKGRFAAGNIGGPGNPFARQVAGLRAALLQSITPKDMADIAMTLRMLALQGNLAAIKLLLLYTIGKPTEPVNPDTLDIEEFQQIYLPQKEIYQETTKVAQTISPAACNTVVQCANAITQHKMGEVLKAPEEQRSKLMQDYFPRTGSAREDEDARPNRHTNDILAGKYRDEVLPENDDDLVAAGLAPPWLGSKGRGGPSANGGNGRSGPSTNGGNVRRKPSRRD